MPPSAQELSEGHNTTFDHISQVFIVRATGIWPFFGRPGPKVEQQPITILDISTSKDFVQVRRNQALSDGRWCHILEVPNGSELWIDVEHGCAVKRRLMFLPTTGKYAGRQDLNCHSEIIPGIWFPRQIVNYEDVEGRKIRGTILVESIRLNDVREDLFRFHPPPGALHFDQEKTATQVVPGGLDLLSDLSEYVDKYSQSPTPATNVRVADLILWLGLILVLVAEFRIFVLKRRKNGLPTSNKKTAYFYSVK